ncbi:uip5p [Saccharomyces arboricola H-6]|uniref:Uip5p n=1 Tax=Saccharomyces arboricola (strain H-6 / AS 2.3317 / CBS 10644) TaxID=1160507 RepID=J8LLB3_SACAR|nr:uip5p [Saccharomyces arboricola H-6]
MTRDVRPEKLTISLLILSLFLIFQILTKKYLNNGNENSVEVGPLTHRRSHVTRVANYDASLSIPYLDKINRFWHVGGATQVRNAQSIKLTQERDQNKYGLVLSNGIGDNTINDFEIVYRFRISHESNTQLTGDGMCFVITPENEFLTQDLKSSYARRQYMMNSHGIIGDNTDLMGFPKNLPGLFIVLDTYRNQGHDHGKVPFMDVFLNVAPESESYDIDSDGELSTSLRLNSKAHIELKKNVLWNEVTKLRIIYLESVSFLKIDIQYAKEGNYWIELFQTTENLFLPKNIHTGQRYIGCGALNGQLTETVELLDVSTSEFHWNDKDESIEDTYDYVKEAELFLEQEFGEILDREPDEFTKWKMVKAQPNIKSASRPPEPSAPTHPHSRLPRAILVIWHYSEVLLLIIGIYLISVYIRVFQRRFRTIRLRRQRANSHSVGLLPM